VENLPLWRDAALILLIIEAFILALIPGIILFFAQKYLRVFRRWLKLPLLQTQLWALRIQQSVQRGTEAIAAVPIEIYAFSARVKTTARALWKIVR
jgi:hypothetical protein